MWDVIQWLEFQAVHLDMRVRFALSHLMENWCNGNIRVSKTRAMGSIPIFSTKLLYRICNIAFIACAIASVPIAKTVRSKDTEQCHGVNAVDLCGDHMSRTNRKPYNYWTKEARYIRKAQRRSYRRRVKAALRKNRDPEQDPPRTEGWLTW